MFVSPSGWHARCPGQAWLPQSRIYTHALKGQDETQAWVLDSHGLRRRRGHLGSPTHSGTATPTPWETRSTLGQRAATPHPTHTRAHKYTCTQGPPAPYHLLYRIRPVDLKTRGRTGDDNGWAKSWSSIFSGAYFMNVSKSITDVFRL